MNKIGQSLNVLFLRPVLEELINTKDSNPSSSLLGVSAELSAILDTCVIMCSKGRSNCSPPSTSMN